MALWYEQTYLRSLIQSPSVNAFSQLLNRDYPGAKYICDYESGVFGLRIQQEMEVHGIACVVFHAADIPKSVCDVALVQWRLASHALSLKIVNAIP